MDAFYGARRSVEYPLAVNDVVLVKRGRKPGERAAVITIESPAPDPRYLIEYGDGSDDVVALSDLEQQPDKSVKTTRGT